MAGSLSHLTDKNGEFCFELIDNLGDAEEACEECFNRIRELKVEKEKIRDYLGHEREMHKFVSNEMSTWINRCMKAEKKLEEFKNDKED